jgi:DNA-binding response OmpR family regulator
MFLVYETDMLFLGQLVAYMRGSGSEVVCVSSANALLMLARQNHPEAVICTTKNTVEDTNRFIKSIKDVYTGAVCIIEGSIIRSLDAVKMLPLASGYFLKTDDIGEIVAGINAASLSSHNARFSHDCVPRGPSWRLNRIDSVLIAPNENEIKLTSTEVRVVKALMSAGGPIDKRDLSQMALGRGYNSENKSLDVTISNIRKKIKECFDDDKGIVADHITRYKLSFEIIESYP